MIQNRVCRQCGRSFQGGPRAYYCPSCRDIRRRERDNGLKKAGPVRPLGSMDICERCGKPYIVMSGLQRFCPACRPVHNREYDRKTGLAFYRENSDQINPVRNDRRRVKLRFCVICGKEFPSDGTCRNTCSDECRRKQRQEWQHRSDAKRCKNQPGS